MLVKLTNFFLSNILVQKIFVSPSFVLYVKILNYVNILEVLMIFFRQRVVLPQCLPMLFLLVHVSVRTISHLNNFAGDVLIG